MLKAEITSRFHSNQPEIRKAQPSDYSYDDIARGVKVISDCVQRIAAYARATQKRFRTVVYEDFRDGVFGSVEAICDEFGLSRRTESPPRLPRNLERTTDAINEEWCARFRREMDGRTRRRVDRHEGRAQEKRRTSILSSPLSGDASGPGDEETG
jgi:LPS sulfotransferase NodH